MSGAASDRGPFASFGWQAVTGAPEMAIEETELDVPLYRVVEHIVGDLPHLITCRRSAKIAEWDRALTKLIAAARKGELKVSGRRNGKTKSKVIRPSDFAQIADNPVADFSFDNEWSEKRVLEFSAEGGATILDSHSNGKPTVLWTDVCADSGADVLRLWPPKPPAGEPAPPDLRKLLEEANAQKMARKGNPLTYTEGEGIALDNFGAKHQTRVRELLIDIRKRQPRGRNPKRA